MLQQQAVTRNYNRATSASHCYMQSGAGADMQACRQQGGC